MPTGRFAGRVLGPYILLDLIAVGGMAEIYLAKTSGVAGFEKFLCLKVLHPDYAGDEQFIEMLIDEAKLAVGLNHVNIAQIFDLGKDGDIYYIAMEYVDGADLFKMMRSLSEKEQDVPIDVAAYVAQEICTGLDYAHRKRDRQGRPLGIIHRDISPQNIIISHWGEVKIIDFGIAKAASRSRHTQAGVIKGKYYYMSPEQAWGDMVDHRTDIFSTGIILYEVLIGQMLYLEEDMQRLMEMVRRADIEPPSRLRPDIPPQLENVVMKALAKRPEDRWQTANELQVALTSFLYSYSPDFTPERLAHLLKQALEAVERQAPEHLPEEEVVLKVEDEQIMSRVDFQPPREHSVIFRMDDLRAARPAGRPDQDDDVQTLVAPSGAAAIEVGLAPVPVPAGLAGAWEDDGPTTISGTPLMLDEEPSEVLQILSSADIEDMDAPRAGPGRAVPREILVPRAQAPKVPAARPRQAATDDEEPTFTPMLRPATPAPPSQVARSSPRNMGPASRPASGNTGPLPAAASPHDGRWATPQGGSPPRPAVQGPASRPLPGQAPLPAAGRGGLAGRLAAAGEDGHGSRAPHPSGAYPSGPVLREAEAPSPAGRPQAVKLSTPTGPRHPQVSAQPSAPAPQPMPQAWPQAMPPSASLPPWAQGNAALSEGDVDLTVERLSRRRRRPLKVAAALLLVLAVLGGVGAAVFYAVQAEPEEGGLLEIVSVPAGARVVFNGAALDEATPVSVPVKDLKKDYKVEVSLRGHQSWNETVSFQPGSSRLRVYAVLSAIYGKLIVRSQPSGAAVYLNGEMQGITPAAFENLSQGETWVLELRLKGYAPATQTIAWEDRPVLELEIPLKKEP